MDSAVAFGKPPYPKKKAFGIALIGMVFALIFLVVVGATGSEPMSQRGVPEFLAICIAVFGGLLIALGIFAIGGPITATFSAPAAAWIQFLRGRRLYLKSGEWLLDLEGNEWTLHQSTTPILKQLGHDPRGVRALLEDIEDLRVRLRAGELPQIEQLVIPAGFLKGRSFKKCGLNVRPAHRKRGARVLEVTLGRLELWARRRLKANANARDMEKYPVEGFASRASFASSGGISLRKGTP